MKRALLFFPVIFVFSYAFCQYDNNLLKPFWSIGKEKEVYGSLITRLEGKNLSSVTNIGYQTLTQKKNRIEADSRNEMWTQEEKDRRVNMYETSATGGIIYFYIVRSTIEAANTDKFTVIIHDSTEKELFRARLESKIPSPPLNGGSWWNVDEIALPVNMSGPFFYVYIIDHLDRENSRYKFQVKLN